MSDNTYLPVTDIIQSNTQLSLIEEQIEYVE